MNRMSRKQLQTGQNRSVTRAAGIVSFFTFLSRILGLVRDMVLATLFGSGVVADAFFVAFRIPNLLRRLFAEGSLTISFIPVFTEYLEKRDKKDALELAQVVLTIVAASLVARTFAGIILSPWIVRIQVFGFGGSGTRYELTVLLTRITFPYIFFISIVAFFMGVLNSFRKFAAPAAAPILLNVGIIGAAFLISPHLKEPIVGVAIGVLIGGALQLGLQLPWAVKLGLKLWPRWDPGHPALKRIGKLMVPAVFGSAVYQFNQIVNTFLASFLREGSISWLYYADRLVQFLLGIFAIAISTAALPSLSTHAATEDFGKFSDTISHAMRLVLFISIPSLVGLLILGKPIVTVLFKRGAFSSFDVVMTYRALFCYSVGLWAFSGIRVIVSGFYAIQDTMTPVKVAIVALCVNFLLGVILMRPMGHSGLALALSISSALQFGILIILFRIKAPMIHLRHVLLSTGKCVLGATVMGMGIYLLNVFLLPFSEDARVIETVSILGALILIGITLYFGMARILRCEELSSLAGLLKIKSRN